MTTPPDTALLTTNSETLAPLLPILNAFAHRHKNQHSSSHWWSSFSILRRAVRNLAGDLVLRPKKTKSSNAKRESHPALGRAKWMMRHVVPCAFVAFSQLAADNQHAPLGLLLLSVLARINTVLSHLAPIGHTPEYSTSAVTKPTSSDLKRPTPSHSITSEAAGSGLDRGVAISRDELLLSQKATTKLVPELDTRLKDPEHKERKSKVIYKDTKSHSSKGDAKDRPKKKKKKGGDALSSLFGSL
ncbi:ribonuclease mrp subunit rmp1 [Fusarium heterosporum]|uniref:Ribonuclease mrp subunit rmp1 n=1 Tax=Fusarium heterosporum TaxID=42747 RepID=A0A8H5WMW1_FUSHE|nr:ribonuclease mrp subunit rmp1 [Fusarium heterosporum]